MSQSLRPYLESRFRRLSGPGRVEGLDLARALAVIGMVAVHLVALPEWLWEDPRTWGAIAEGRSSILFATLAGISLALLSGGADRLPPTELAWARVRIAVRALLIWVIGVLLIATGVPVLVILPAYAILFLLAIPMLGLRARTLAVLAAVLALLTPFVYPPLADLIASGGELAAIAAPLLGWDYPFVVWITFVVGGLAVGRFGVQRRRVPVRLVAIGAGLAILAALSDTLVGVDPRIGRGAARALTAEAHSAGVFEVIGSGGFAHAVIGSCLLLCRTPVRWAVLPLRAVGAMPLSAYAAHIVVWALLQPDPGPGGTDLDAFRALEPFWPMTLGIIVACTAWALLVGRGPLEWLLAQATRFARP